MSELANFLYATTYLCGYFNPNGDDLPPASKPNPRALYDLICRVCYLSIETQKIIDGLPPITIDGVALADMPDADGRAPTDTHKFTPPPYKKPPPYYDPPLTDDEKQEMREYEYWWITGRKMPTPGEINGLARYAAKLAAGVDSKEDETIQETEARLEGEFVKQFFPDDYAKHYQQKNNQGDLFDEKD